MCQRSSSSSTEPPKAGQEEEEKKKRRNRRKVKKKKKDGKEGVEPKVMARLSGPPLPPLLLSKNLGAEKSRASRAAREKAGRVKEKEGESE